MADDARPLRTKVAQFRLTEDEFARLRAHAETAGLSVSSYCRAVTLGHRVAAKVDFATISELRRLGGLCKLIHNESRGAYSALTARALAELKAAIARVARR